MNLACGRRFSVRKTDTTWYQLLFTQSTLQSIRWVMVIRYYLFSNSGNCSLVNSEKDNPIKGKILSAIGFICFSI